MLVCFDVHAQNKYRFWFYRCRQSFLVATVYIAKKHSLFLLCFQESLFETSSLAAFHIAFGVYELSIDVFLLYRRPFPFLFAFFF